MDNKNQGEPSTEEFDFAESGTAHRRSNSGQIDKLNSN